MERALELASQKHFPVFSIRYVFLYLNIYNCYFPPMTDDFRLFCGDLGNEVNDDVLTKAFSRYSSFNMARVIRDKSTGKTKGYGFASFANSSDLAAALKEMNGKYVGNRPIKLRKSTWKNRIDYETLQQPKARPQKKLKTQKRSVLHK